ncbi:hypothetical protein TCDM_08068 [Trypanosoma cruzi Dm28c]|uniref:Spermidine synthase n=1 Tax=Trypanosoma cruzi Dm28c TaxID=1416333 RepID=V5D930_TRYCR|nr:hypothetical protein TCDM_08068 [Trypanosoma cruzi Dm28c]
MVYYVEPNRKIDAVWRRPQSRVPMSDSHNVFWGFNIGSDGWRGLPTGRHLAETMTESAEGALRRPRLVYSEDSEVLGPRGESLSVACMELPEYDTRIGNDVVYRSVHYVHGATREKGITPTNVETGEVAAADLSAQAKNGEVGAAGVQPVPAPAKTPLEEKATEEDNSLYFSRMPTRGLSTIHGMTKCRAVTSLNNCVPYAGHIESEYARKMMLTLGPVHILRDIAKTTFPLRFTTAKEAPVSALVCGLHSGEIPRWLSTAFPNFQVDVVERDGTLARICRRFLGFQESNNLHLYLAEPVEFLRRTAVPKIGRRYDLIMLDLMDGAGRLSTQYGRLEFINSVRNSLSGSGCVVVSLPNRDGAFLYNVVQNWRLAFAGRTVILVHCVTSPQTLLMTFQDDATRGKAKLWDGCKCRRVQGPAAHLPCTLRLVARAVRSHRRGVGRDISRAAPRHGVLRRGVSASRSPAAKRHGGCGNCCGAWRLGGVAAAVDGHVAHALTTCGSSGHEQIMGGGGDGK